MKNKEVYSWGEGVYNLLSWFRPEKVKNAKVLVAGAGALGNEVVKNLALFGVGNIVIVDFDTIEISNLTRSVLFREKDALDKRYKAEVIAERAKEINPYINITAICGDLASDVGLGLYHQMDVVIGCLDSRYARYKLNIMSFRANKPWIDGAIDNLDGSVRVFAPGVNCYECGLTPTEFEHIMLRTGCADVVKVNQAAGRIATTPISASLIGAIQVQEAMKIIHSEELESNVFSSLLGKLFKYEGMKFSSMVFKYQTYKKDCTAHESWSNYLELPELSAETKVKDALNILKTRLNAEYVEINLRNNKFIEKIFTGSGEKEFTVMVPESKLDTFINKHDELRLLHYREILYQKKYENIDEKFPFQDLSLNEISIPFFDIIQVCTNKGIFYVELSGDMYKYADVLAPTPDTSKI